MSLEECTISMVGQGGQTHETAVEAASLFDAADRAIRRGGEAMVVSPGCGGRGADGLRAELSGWLGRAGVGVTSLAGFAGGALPQAPGGRTWMPAARR